MARVSAPAVRRARSSCWLVAALAGLSLACTGELDGTGVPGAGADGAGAQGTGGGSGGSGASAGTGSGATAGTGAGTGGTPTTGGSGGSAGTMIDPDAPTPPAPANPGKVTLRRLNRVEYNNTVRDLLGTTLQPADAFQADSPGTAGFDTVGAALSIPPAAVRDYETAAYALVDELLNDSTRLAGIVPCDAAAQGETCVRTSLGSLARRAFRRPVSDADLERLLAPFRTAAQLGATPALGLRHSLAAVLIDPHFLFRFEFDADPTSPAPRRLTDHEVATRLSYSLWSTMPDAALFAAADAGTLQTDSELSAQIARMLADPRAEALAQHFAGQWLAFRNLESHDVDARFFPTYEPALATSMKLEAERFFADFLRAQRPLNELLNARFTYVDAPLARHYGLPVQTGGAPGVMWLADTSTVERAGLLTLGAVLTTTSLAGRTSPVKRGDFVLKHLMCQPVQAPPPDIEGLPDTPDPSQGQLTLRQRMEQHRQDPSCFGCHSEMDPLGFGLENYDAIGQYRTTDNGLPVDAAGELPDGRRFSGALELANVLATDSRFNTCVAKNLMVFALGRTLDQRDDSVWIAHVAGTTRDAGGQLSTLVRTLLSSEAFRSRQAAFPAL